MRNEIFARHGYKFTTEKMRKYFNKQKWYKPRFRDVTAKLTKIEIANVKILKQLEIDLKKKKSSLKISKQIQKQKRKFLFKASRGSGLKDLGWNNPQEANPVGPMSFCIDRTGRILILDQINKRIQVFNSNGRHNKTIPISTSTFSDIAIGQSGNLFLLDPWINRAVFLIDEKGNELRKLKLTGKGIIKAQNVGEIYSRKDGLWITYKDYIVRICDASGEPFKDRQISPGKFSENSNYLIKVKNVGERSVTATRSEFGKIKADTYTIYFSIPVQYITLLDTDKKGNIYLGVNLLKESIGQGPPYSIEQSHEIIVILDSKGREKKRIYMPVSTKAEEVNRSIRVTADGIIYQLVIEEEEAKMWRYNP